MLVEILILITTVMVMRVVPRLFYPKIVPNSDTFFHLWNARYFHKHKKPHPMELEGMNGTGYYPFLYHMLLGLGGERYQRTFEVISSPLFDAIAVVSVYIFSKSVISISGGGIYYSSFPFWLAILYGTSPIMFQRMPGPRSFEGTPRSLGETLFLLMALSVLSAIFLPVPAWLCLGFAVLCGGLMLLTSKFSLQALIFVFIPASILSNRVDLLFFPFLIVLTAILISYGKYISILKFQLVHLNTYARQTQKIMPRMMDRNNPKRIANKVKQIWRDKQYLRLLAIAAYDITPTALIYKCPNFIFALLIVLNILGSWDAPPELNHYIFRIWFWATMFPMFFTSFYPFLFLGEAERYQDYSLFPQYIFITSYFFKYNSCLLIMEIQICIYLFCVCQLILRLRKNKLKSKHLKEISNFVNKKYANTSVVAILNEITHELAYYLKDNDVFPSICKYDINAFYKYPYVHPERLNKFIIEQNARLIIVEYLAEKNMTEKHNRPYNLAPWPKKVFGNESFYILEVDQHG